MLILWNKKKIIETIEKTWKIKIINLEKNKYFETYDGKTFKTY